MLNLNPNTTPSTGSGSSAPVLEAGTYPGVISLIVDLGVQKQKKFDSRMKSDDDCTEADYDTGHFLWYSYALPTERYESEYDGEVTQRDQVVGEQLRVSSSDKAKLVLRYKAIVKDGRSYGEMLGMPVTVTTGLTSGGKAKVMSVTAPMRGMAVGEPLRAPLLVTDADYDKLEDLELPPFIKEMIANRVQ